MPGRWYAHVASALPLGTIIGRYWRGVLKTQISDAWAAMVRYARNLERNYFIFIKLSCLPTDQYITAIEKKGAFRGKLGKRYSQNHF